MSKGSAGDVIAIGDAVGLKYGEKGTHTSRTIMLAEVSDLFRLVDRAAVRADYAGAKHVTVVWLSALWPEMPAGGDMADFLAHRRGDAAAVRKELDQALAERRANAAEHGLLRRRDAKHRPLPELSANLPCSTIAQACHAPALLSVVRGRVAPECRERLAALGFQQLP